MANENQKNNPPQEEAGESTNLQLPRSYGNLLGSNTPAGKSEWPELVGLAAEEAERKVKEEMIGIEVRVVPPNYGVTCDWKSNRVRLYVDSSGKVQRPPRIG